MLDQDKYIITQNLISIRETFTIRDSGGQVVGKAHKKIVSIGAQYFFRDKNGHIFGQIHEKIIRIRPSFKIFDADNNKLATMKKKFFKLIGTEYWFDDASGREILRAKGNFLHHNYNLFSQNKKVASINKKWVSIRDSYGVEILAPVDRLVVLGAVICIDLMEHSERSRKNKED